MMSGLWRKQKVADSGLRQALIEVVSVRRTRRQDQAKTKYEELFQTFQKFALTESQVQAAVSHAKETLVVAGAGSGKTSLLLGRAKYLIDSGRATPEQILILAFNKKAAVELTDRATALGMPITAKTFHAFGKSIVEASGDSRTVVFTESFEIDKFYETEFERMKADRTMAPVVARFLAQSLIPIRPTESFDDKSELAAFVRSLPKTLNGERVKSHGEWMIANFLWSNGVPYGYERLYSHGGRGSVHKPDFQIDNSNIYIEYFGIDNDQSTAPWIDNQKYLSDMQWKRNVHAQNRSVLVELTYGDLKSGNLIPKLKTALANRGILLNPKSEEQIFVQAQAQKYQIRLLSTFTAFHQHVRARRPDLQLLRNEASRLGPRYNDFIDLFFTVYKSYEQTLLQLGQPDFSDLIHQSADLINENSAPQTRVIQQLDRLAEIGDREISSSFARLFTGAKRVVLGWQKLTVKQADEALSTEQSSPLLTKDDGSSLLPYTHLLVDEFQDISYDRYRLIQSLSNFNPNLQTTFVGDDWQAIYSFAGSDIGIMRESAKARLGRMRVDLGDTFRLPQTLADAASSFVTQNPAQLRKEIKSTFDEGEPLVLHWDTSTESDSSLENIKKVISRIGSDANNPDCELQVIARYKNNLPTVAELSRLWSGPVKTGTIHSVKGLEADYVIVVDVKQDFRGFPSTILDDPVIQLVVPSDEKFKYAEERRLFYVAITRARKQTHLICPSEEPSVFATELLDKTYNGRQFGKHYGTSANQTCPNCNNGHLVLNRFGNYTCSSHPICDVRLPACPTCHKYMRLTSIAPVTYVCGDHSGEQLPPCPKCRFGRLIERQGKNGLFTSCHLWPDTGCQGR
jgi:DNA helicase-4